MYNEYVNKNYIRFVFRGRVKFPTGGYSPRPILQKIAESVKFRYRQYSLDKEDRAYLTTLDQITLTLFSLENRVFHWRETSKSSLKRSPNRRISNEEHPCTENGCSSDVCCDRISFTVFCFSDHAGF